MMVVPVVVVSPMAPMVMPVVVMTMMVVAMVMTVMVVVVMLRGRYGTRSRGRLFGDQFQVLNGNGLRRSRGGGRRHS